MQITSDGDDFLRSPEGNNLTYSHYRNAFTSTFYCCGQRLYFFAFFPFKYAKKNNITNFIN